MILIKVVGSRGSRVGVRVVGVGLGLGVVVDDKELEYINQKDKDSKVINKSYDEYITSKQNGKNYHYICPRFWCLRDSKGKKVEVYH